MGKRANMYQVVVTAAFVVAVAFFAHNPLGPVTFDVLNINQTVTVFGMDFYIGDIFPWKDFKKENAYGDPVRMDVQIYVQILTEKLGRVMDWLIIYYLLLGFNLLARDLPGREFRRMPHLALLMLALFGYDFLDFIFTASQTDWKLQALVFFALLLSVVIFNRDGKSK